MGVEMGSYKSNLTLEVPPSISVSSQSTSNCALLEGGFGCKRDVDVRNKEAEKRSRRWESIQRAFSWDAEALADAEDRKRRAFAKDRADKEAEEEAENDK